MGCDGKDRILPLYPLPDGRTVISRHRPNHTEEVAVAGPSVAGRPMAVGEECVTTRRRDDGTYEVIDSYVHGGRTGPAQVATEGYRTGWSRTFNAPGGRA
jgi:hypothetical protein